MTKNKILLIDDEISIINSIIDVLEDMDDGFEVFQTSNPLNAVKIAEAKLPDLVIADWKMPGLSGIDLIKQFKQNEFLKDIPVIICTGTMLNSEHLHEALQAGAVDYIRKPIDKLEIQARVRSMLIIANSYKKIKLQNEEIEIERKFLNTLINTIPHPVFFYDLNGICQGFNKMFTQIFENNVACRLGSSVYHFFQNDSVDIHIKNDKLLVDTAENINYECSITYPGKNKYDILFEKAVYKNNNNKASGIICLMIDITLMKSVANQVLESQKKELASTALRLLQANEINEKIIKDLYEINLHTDKKGNELIKSLICSYQLQTNESAWLEFDLRFKEIYNDFYDKLNKCFPDLTSNERKLCAFIRLDMSTKDIASITCQNPQSIDMARYRLRKKLNLSQDDNLNSFIASI